MATHHQEIITTCKKCGEFFHTIMWVEDYDNNDCWYEDEYCQQCKKVCPSCDGYGGFGDWLMEENSIHECQTCNGSGYIIKGE